MSSVPRDPFTIAVAQLKKYSRGPDDLRHQSITHLTEVLEESRRDGPDAFESFLDQVVQKTISQLVQSSDALDVATGTMCIQALMEVEVPLRHLMLLGNALRRALLSPDKMNLLLAAHTLSTYATVAGSTARDLIDQQVTNAVQWLGEADEDKRYPAVVVLRNLAISDRVHFGKYAAQVCDAIWRPLGDNQSYIREAAAEVMRATLVVVNDRSSSDNNHIYRNLWTKCRSALEQKKVEIAHGALLVLVDILRSSLGVLDQYFMDAWALTWSFRDSPFIPLKHLVLRTIPALIATNVETFLESNLSLDVTQAVNAAQSPSPLLQGTMTHLLNMTAKEIPIADKAVAFTAVTDLVTTLSRAVFEPFLEKSIYAVKDLLQTHKKLNKPPVWDALLCLARIASKCPTTMTQAHVVSCYDAAFAWGLSPQLTTALAEISSACPSLKKTIQLRLLDLVSITICGLPFRNTVELQRPSSAPQPIDEVDRRGQIVLALVTLRNFDFSDADLTEFTRDCVVPYFRDEEAVIRSEAVVTACHVLLPSSARTKEAPQEAGIVSVSSDDVYPAIMKLTRYHGVNAVSSNSIQTNSTVQRGHKKSIIHDVLDQVIALGVSDSDPRIRQSVFENLGTDFDPYLVEGHYIELIFMACNDSNSKVVSLAITLLGRMSYFKPAHILPAVRRHFLELLTVLESLSSGLKGHQESLVRLSLLLAAAPHIMRIYGENIVRALDRLTGYLSGARDVSIAYMNCLTALACVMGQTLKQSTQLDGILSKVVPLLQLVMPDRTSILKRYVAMRTLCAVFRLTGDAVDPYRRHPTLLPNILSILRSDSAAEATKIQAITLLGVLGALDPVQVQDIINENSKTQTSTAVNQTDVKSDGITQLVLSEVVMFLPTANSSGLQKMAVRTLTDVIVKCPDSVNNGDIILEPFFELLRTTRDVALVKLTVQQIGAILRSGKVTLTTKVKEMVDITMQLWTNDALVSSGFSLLSSVGAAAGVDIKAYLPALMPLMLRSTAEAENIPRYLKVLVSFGKHLQESLPAVVPSLMKIGLQTPAGPHNITALRTLRHIGEVTSLGDVVNPILQPIQNALGSGYTLPQDVFSECMALLCVLVQQLGSSYLIFVSSLHRVIKSQKMQYPMYDGMIATLLRGTSIPSESVSMTPEQRTQLDGWLQPRESSTETVSIDSTINDSITQTTSEGETKLSVNPAGIEGFCNEILQRTLNKEEWMTWYSNLQLEVLAQGPHQALRLVSSLLRHAHTVSKPLFNSAFRAVWGSLTAKTRQSLVRAIEAAFASLSCHNDVRLGLLVLVEYMDVHDCPLPINPTHLAGVAIRTNCVAKALRWREMEFHTGPSDINTAIEETLTLYQQLAQPESAEGMLAFAQKEYSMTLMEGWYEKLGRWKDSLTFLDRERAYWSKQRPDGYKPPSRCRRATTPQSTSLSTSVEITSPLNEDDLADRRLTEIDSSIIRCLYKLSEWSRLHQTVKYVWGLASQASEARNTSNTTVQSLEENETTGDEDETLQTAIASYATAAAWRMSDWDFFEETWGYMDEYNVDRSVYGAILNIHKEKWDEAQQFVGKARTTLIAEITHRVSEGYERAYNHIVLSQLLAELEEIVLVQRTAGKVREERLELVSKLWQDRLLKSVVASADIWGRLLPVHSLLLPADKEMSEWLTYVSLCTRKGQTDEALWVLNKLHADPKTLEIKTLKDGNVAFAYAKQQYGRGVAHSEIRGMLERVVSSLHAMPECNQRNELLCSVLLKLSELVPTQDAVQRLEDATKFDPDYALSWHMWAVSNTELLDSAAVNTPASEQFLVNAIKGYINSIIRETKNSAILQDALRLMSLWFKYGGRAKVVEVMTEGIEKIPIETWVMVLPQLLARTNIAFPHTATAIRKLLLRVGEANPQAVIYPLMVAMTSSVEGRREAAEEILNGMKTKYPNLVKQAVFVSNEFIRLAILWHEMWFDKLEEASKAFFDRKDYEGMVNLLLPLHDSIQSPETISEAWFCQAFGRELAEAKEWCLSFLITKNVHDLHHAWDGYIQVFWKVAKLVQQNPAPPVELQFCSPKLLEARDLELTVPGQPSQGAARIRSFNKTLTVLASKQRPRRLTVHGDDGKEYKFLLKGHEDLRLDERVMQLFQLLNTLLSSDSICSRISAIQIQRYAVIPLSINVGLIGWMDACDTIHQMIKEYREAKKIQMNVENKHILHMISPQNNYDLLPLMGKMEVFQYVWDNTSGQDIHRVLWLRSLDAETWVERRRIYTRSLASSSMAGYILGLGDRHPNNLMVQRGTGKVVHIDFGDCFEVTMTRDKYPEKIPFRLTRMLTNAMELGSVEGLYRLSCENVMRVIRKHKDSVMAMLEAFVHDPLISWRLETKAEAPEEEPQGTSTEEDAALLDAETTLSPIGIDRTNAHQFLNSIDTVFSKYGKDLEALQQAFNVVLRHAVRSVDEGTKHPRRSNVENVVKDEEIDAGQVSHKGMGVIKRIQDKLNGNDFSGSRGVQTSSLAVPEQVSKLIEQATSVENLCQCYTGWCPFW